jgi:hypothetical protein
VYPEGDHYVIYLEQLQAAADWFRLTDVGWEFNVNRLGDWIVKPNNVTYRKLKFDIDDTDVANVWSESEIMVIKRTGTFELTASDMDGYSKISKTVKFIVKDEFETKKPVKNVEFSTREFTRTVGEYVNLNKFVTLTRVDLTGNITGYKNYVFKQHLRAWDGMWPNTESRSKIAQEFGTVWKDDGSPTYGGQMGYTEVDTQSERFYIRWKSSNSAVAKVMNAKDILIDNTSIEQTATWIPTLDGTYWTDFYTYGSGTVRAQRLAWYSKQDKQFIYPAQGYVRAMKAGTAKITVEIVNYGTDKVVYSASTTIVVKEPEDPFNDPEPTPEFIKIKKIKLNFKHNPKTMYVGDKESINEEGDITIKPSNATNKTLTFSSSNKKIVSVSKDGVLKAKKPGTVTITVSTTDGSGVSKSFKVEVLEK